MAPFAILKAGYNTVFQGASFVFSCPGADVGAWDLIFGPRVNILARGPCLANLGSQEAHFYHEMLSWWQFRGFPVTQMNSVLPRTHFGKLLCPKPLIFYIAKGFLPYFPGKLQQGLPCYPDLLPIYLVF
jgi:hypothetical protein